MSSQHEEQLGLIEMLPSAWSGGTVGNSVWVVGYRVFRVTKDELASGPKFFDLHQVRGIIAYGKVRYPNRLILTPTDEQQIHFTVPHKIMEETAEGAYLLLITPFDSQSLNEFLIKEKINTAVGLLAVFNGRNMVYEYLFDSITNLNDGRTMSTSLVIEHPLHFMQPDISDSRLIAISESDRAITALPESEQNRIRLSLRWFESALYAGASVDAYLRYWFAIETLGMPNTTNIRPLVESLSRVYNLSYETTQSRFSIGRLFGLRSRIVHDGQIIPIHQQLSKYLEALYADILFEHLGLSSERRAEDVLNDPTFELRKYLHEPSS